MNKELLEKIEEIIITTVLIVGILLIVIHWH